MVLCNAQQTAGQAQQWMWHGDREEALDKNMPSQPVFPWQTSMQAQLQGIITDVAEVQTSRGKVREPAGLHRFAVQTDNCQDKDKRGAGIYSRDLGIKDRAGEEVSWWIHRGKSRTRLFKKVNCVMGAAV